MARTALLVGHIVAGTAGLLLGPAAVLASRRGAGGWGGRCAGAYQAAVAVLAVSAVGLVALAPARLWWLLPFAVGTETAAALGWRLRRLPGSSATRVRLLGGSYVSLVTAVLVVSRGDAASWVVPSLVGVVAVETAAHRAGRDAGRDPAGRGADGPAVAAA